MEKANQDIRQYMEDRGVSQRTLAAILNTNQTKISIMLRTEMSEAEKRELIRHIDEAVLGYAVNDTLDDVDDTGSCEENDISCTTKFQIGDRVKIPAKTETIGVVTDIWASMAHRRTMYEVAYESNGTKGMYAEEQLELAPIPAEYTFETKIDGNVAVVAMIATQGEKTRVYARGHAHILHNGEVGMAQAVSYAAKRMFESLDTKQENKIYFKG